MSSFTYTVSQEHEGMTVGVYLKYIHGVSSRNIKSLKKHPKGITLNGEHTRTIDKISLGDIVGINIIDEPQQFLHSDIHVDVLYEDSDVIIFNKPADMTCHPSRNYQDDTLGNVFARIMDGRGEAISFRCINRLDKGTSGAVVIGKNQHSTYMLQKNIKKVYVGITDKPLPSDNHIIEGNILRIDEIHIKRMVHPDGQYSRTDYKLMKSCDKYYLYEFYLHTGRTHQIRVHTSNLDCPLVGDPLYGGDVSTISRQALHCFSVEFTSPTTGELIKVEAPLPSDMAMLIK